MLNIHTIEPMSKTIVRKKSKQKEIDPKFGVSEWDPAELDVRQTRHGTYESRPPPRGGTWRDQIKEEAYKLRQRQREADPLSLYLLIPLQIPWILMRPKKLINK